MAAVTRGTDALDLLVSWERAPGVASRELAATWCALEIRVNGEPVTLVEDAREGGLRKAVHTSAYPLAEWIATRWWPLREHLRPSATSVRGWTWARNAQEPWLRDHNLRGAGDGMPWPDLTIVPEGGLTRVVWKAGGGLAGQSVLSLTSGDAYLSPAAVREGLARFVTQVLDRLGESGETNTVLHQEWAALGDLDDEEQEYAAAAARLGLDPFDVDQAVAGQIEALSREFDPPLLEEFLDSADAARLPLASQWLARARASVTYGVRARPELSVSLTATEARPWEGAYHLAQACRAHLDPTDRIELRDLVGLTHIGGDPAGLQGVVQISGASVGLALPEDPRSSTATRFAQARALGLSFLAQRTTALLDPTRTDLAKASRAFAAELLAPAQGIAEYLRVFPVVTDRALDAVADRFETSPLLIQHQHENQPA